MADSLEKWFSNDNKNIRKWKPQLKTEEENQDTFKGEQRKRQGTEFFQKPASR